MNTVSKPKEIRYCGVESTRWIVDCDNQDVFVECFDGFYDGFLLHSWRGNDPCSNEQEIVQKAIDLVRAFPYGN